MKASRRSPSSDWPSPSGCANDRRGIASEAAPRLRGGGIGRRALGHPRSGRPRLGSPDRRAAGVDQPEWIATSSGNRAEWRGGPVPPRAFDSFALRAKMPDREGTVSFVGRELFDDGPGPTFNLDVVLAGGRGALASGDGRDEGARTLGKAALFVSIAAPVLAAAGFFLGLGRWLRGA